MRQVVHLDFLPRDYVIEHQIKTVPAAEMHVIWSFLLIIGGIFSGIAIQQQFPMVVRYVSIIFVLYTIFVLLTYRSYFIIDPKHEEIIYHNDVFFFGKKEIFVTTFDEVTDILAYSENDGFRNYLVIIYSFESSLSAKRIHDHDSLDQVHEYGQMFAKMMNCSFHPFVEDQRLLQSKYQLNNFERQRGCTSTIGLILLFVSAMYLCFRYF
ncbi:hypothetical protein [Candidatus Uabimicrobium amorphum]|uniref:Uncharacterized protein n=1 Tax=Uabimicrobium amorphum TaxID=2596890 RepID=A0A5S9ING0_UABAM|nr:hypothetical protein [Candidatus Uabimicrobium amorphum]BBM84760.1 hypothetical protein UABAM_03121 [Candidatus Uabimicrobium amorphum]